MPKWIKNIEIHLDNTGVNKLYMIIGALSELCLIRKLKSASLFYFIPGHSKVIICQIDIIV